MTNIDGFAKALLVEVWEPAERYRDEFNAWYDSEYMPSRLEIPGVLTARRFDETNNGGGVLAYYDLESPGVLDDDPYISLRSSVSERELELTMSVARHSRCLYQTMGTYPAEGVAPDDVCGPVLGCVWWQSTKTTDDELNAWYAEEHIPLVLQVPGWRRVRRFSLLEGPGPLYLATHEVESMETFARPEHRVATSTPWRRVVISHREQYERRIYSVASRLA